MRNAYFGLPVIALALTLGGCEFSPKVTSQNGYRGTGINEITTKATLAKQYKANFIPPAPYELGDITGERANKTYENVQVLGDLSTEEFNRLMASITEWVAPPEQGCNYCHNPANMASDEVYQKGVARRMIQMTRNINVNWKSHVQNTGVTCWTCHRGQGVPQYKWAALPPDPKSIRGNKYGGQNGPNAAVSYASLPSDIYTPYLLNAENIRIASTQSYGKGIATPIQSAEKTYGLMMRFSSALNVNCTYCHNSNNFADWSNSSPQRALAWYAIRMTREMNRDYIQPLAPVFPASGKGPMGDPWKVNCMTCHQGVNKPMGGVSMLGDHPALKGPRPPVGAAPAAPASAKTPVAAIRVTKPSAGG